MDHRQVDARVDGDDCALVSRGIPGNDNARRRCARDDMRIGQHAIRRIDEARSHDIGFAGARAHFGQRRPGRAYGGIAQQRGIGRRDLRAGVLAEPGEDARQARGIDGIAQPREGVARDIGHGPIDPGEDERRPHVARQAKARQHPDRGRHDPQHRSECDHVERSTRRVVDRAGPGPGDAGAQRAPGDGGECLAEDGEGEDAKGQQQCAGETGHADGLDEVR